MPHRTALALSLYLASLSLSLSNPTHDLCHYFANVPDIPQRASRATRHHKANTRARHRPDHCPLFGKYSATYKYIDTCRKDRRPQSNASPHTIPITSFVTGASIHSVLDPVLHLAGYYTNINNIWCSPSIVASRRIRSPQTSNRLAWNSSHFVWRPHDLSECPNRHNRDPPSKGRRVGKLLLKVKYRWESLG